MSLLYKKKLIEVSLPLEAINRESAREKSIRHGHPSTLHLWWARRPLAACRAVLFAQLVDDPSAHPDQFPTEAEQAVERKRLFDIIERLVVWENINDEALLKEAHEEILKSTNGNPPVILDPFAGGGSIPLEAQRLGLEAHASDLNPVAVLINKALIAIPPKWAGSPPVFPGAAEGKMVWPRATGLAEDIRRYGEWIRDEAEKRIGHTYPKVKLEDGSDAIVIAWVWARTVACPNPACGIQMPLVRSWWLCKRKNREAFVIPSVVDGQVQFSIGRSAQDAPLNDEDGTVGRKGARCIACGTAVPLEYVRQQGKAQLMGAQLMAAVAEGDRQRYYVAPSADQVCAANIERPIDPLQVSLPDEALGFRIQGYGMRSFADLFSSRQLTALTTFSDLVSEVLPRIRNDASAAGLSDDARGIDDGGMGALAYAESIAIYLTLAIGRSADYWSSLCSWHVSREIVRNTFGRQALPMVWDFAETNPFSQSTGNAAAMIEWTSRAVARTPARGSATVEQADAARRSYADVLVATDPPYYDNVPYADLADFFYGWLRRSLRTILPREFSTVQTPKEQELVADPFRRGGKRQAATYFESGFHGVFGQVQESASNAYPVTVFYAFKQVEASSDEVASTGWQTLLEGMMKAGWEITATWPMRTELGNRMRNQESNALASSIVLALRPRLASAETINRRGFVYALHDELPARLKELQQGSIAPVDLAQAAIGPGMAVFSRHGRVIEADGSEMTVRTALALINQVLDEVLSEQEGDFDVETRFAVKWFSQFGWNEGASGEADVLSRAMNTTVTLLERGGIFRAAAGRAHLVEPADMAGEWAPGDDKSISVWEVAVRLGHALMTEGTEQAATWMQESASRVDLNAVRELAYLMYSICERKGWADSAMLFNSLGTSWSELAGVARAVSTGTTRQTTLQFGEDDVN